MATAKHDSTPISLSVSDIEPINEYPHDLNRQLVRQSVSIQMTASSTLAISSRRASKKSNEIPNDYPFPSVQIERRRHGKTLSMACVSYRLSRRKDLHRRCCRINDIMCWVSLLGLFLMIIDNELAFISKDHWKTPSSLLIKLVVSFSTAILVGLVFYYHYFDINLYCVNNCIEHWRVGVTGKKFTLILLEVLICAIHPFPRHFLPDRYSNDEMTQTNTTTSPCSNPEPIVMTYLPIDVALGLPMFLRIYLWCRYITFHSHMVRDTSSQSLGYLNKVSMDFNFVIKTYFQQSPTRCLIIFCTIIFFVGSWSLRACDFKSNQEHISIFDAMWFFVVTFTTVGYGDLTPATYCARVVATIVSIVGILVSALLIAVVSQKLTLTRREKYVHNFLRNSELMKIRTNQSANIIIYAWKMWFLIKKNKDTSFEYLQAQRKFFRAITFIKKIKQKQRRLVDQSLDVSDLLISQRESSKIGEDLTQQITTMKLQINHVEKKLDDIGQAIQIIQQVLSQSFDSDILR